MLKNKFLLLGTMSVLFSTTVFGTQSQNDCAGGVCFVKLDNLKPSAEFVKKKESPITLKNPRYIEELDKTITIVLDGETIAVFPHASYVMSEEEKINYYSENRAIEQNEQWNKEANEDLLLVGEQLERIEDKILEKSTLPRSEYFCEKDQEPIYDKASGLFQCV